MSGSRLECRSCGGSEFHLTHDAATGRTHVSCADCGAPSGTAEGVLTDTVKEGSA